MMKHKRHQKDRRDKNEKVHRHDEDHRYYKAEYCAKRDSKQYTMKDISENYGDAREPKKLIIYIVIIALWFLIRGLNCGRFFVGSELKTFVDFFRDLDVIWT